MLSLITSQRRRGPPAAPSPLVGEGGREMARRSSTLARYLPTPHPKGNTFAEKNNFAERTVAMIRKLPSGKYRLYSRKKNPKTGKRRNLGTFGTRAAAEKHERAVQYFKRGG